MTQTSGTRPPYLAALAVGLAVFIGYLLTLAPTVTFWDAGEFIAAAKTLGIPHPPGTPLFVLIAHVWGTLVPVGEFAYRTNMLSALLSAGAAACFFLVAHESLRGEAEGLDEGASRLLRIGGAAAAAVIGAFTFTNWQNSNETEVYGIATFTVAAICWLCLVWRARRGTGVAPRILLLIVYLGGISMGNHLLALLVGPAVVMFIWATLRQDPAPEPERRRAEWAQLAVVAGVWTLLIGTGLGHKALSLVGVICFLAAAGFAASSRATKFAVTTLFLAAIGMTPYLYLYIRSGQNPIINEAAPSTVDALLAVIRREQYPPRTPFDDPTVLSGPNNPGRSLSIIGLQVQNYLLYYHWQWGKGLSAMIGKVPVGVFLVTLPFFSLGMLGMLRQRRADRPAWWLLLTLFLVTGLGLVAYMNFKPGFSLGYDLFPNFEDHEVRERDYFFVVSFVVWGVWAGMGLAALVRQLLRPGSRLPRAAAAGAFAIALVPVALNWRDASRRHGPDARLAADFAYDLLNTAPPYGILFTFGDNDTFPLWWAQEVEGIRRDVTVVCLALGNTDWYIRQLRDNGTREVDRDALPAIWRDSLPAGATAPSAPLHSMTDDQVQAAMVAQVLQQPLTVSFGNFSRTFAAGTFLRPTDVLAIRVIQENLGRRPLVWSVTAGRFFGGLDDRVLQQGLGYRLLPAPPDTTAPGIAPGTVGGIPVDVPVTNRLAWETYRYADLLAEGSSSLETTEASMARALALPFTVLAFVHESEGRPDQMIRNLEQAVKLNPDPALASALDQLGRQYFQAPIPDSSATLPR
jgi:hypothetical protein